MTIVFIIVFVFLLLSLGIILPARIECKQSKKISTTDCLVFNNLETSIIRKSGLVSSMQYTRMCNLVIGEKELHILSVEKSASLFNSIPPILPISLNALHKAVVEVSILPWGQIRISNKNEKEPFLWQYEVDITVRDEVRRAELHKELTEWLIS